MRSALPAIIVALVVLGGAAVAAVSIPDHSVGWNKLTFADKSAERMVSPRDGIPVIVAVAAFELASGNDAGPS